MEATVKTPSARDNFLSAFHHHKSALSESSHGLVQSARNALYELDFPTTRTEEWKYTRTGRISNEQWNIKSHAGKINIAPFLIPDLNADIIVLVNGIYDAELSSVHFAEGVTVTSSHHKIDEPFKFDNIFQALCIAYSTSSLHIHIAKNAYAEKPIHIIHIVTDEQVLAQPILSISAEKSSQLHVVESFVCVGKKKSFTNRLLMTHVEENAQLHIDKIQLMGDDDFLMNEENVGIESKGRFTINTLTLDGGWVRNSLNISLDGQHIETNLNGIFLPRRNQFIDNHTRVDHRFAHCNSSELYKGILNDKSTGVFNGKVYVQPNAQKTNAYQKNANILLSDDAQMNTKPELEIYADDVKCSHGSTTGQMDEEALFYLKSRGLSDDNARKLLTTAFINDVLNKVENNVVREYATNELVKRGLLFV